MLQKSVVRFPYGWYIGSMDIGDKTWPLQWLLVNYIDDEAIVRCYNIGTLAKIADDKCYFVKIENENSPSVDLSDVKMVLYAADHDDYLKALYTDYSEDYNTHPYHARLERLKDLQPIVGREAVEYFIKDFNIKGVEILDESEILKFRSDNYPYKVKWDVEFDKHRRPHSVRDRKYNPIINL